MSRTAVAALRAIFASAVLMVCAVSAAASSPTVLVLGDSLSSAYGLPREAGWVTLLADRLASPVEGRAKYSVVNASIAGETTSGGRTRLPALLKEHRPAVVVIELGGNDALRGLSLAAMRDNLLAMTAASRAAGAQVLLIGMQVPPNYGPDYARRFAATFAEVAHAQRVALVPFLLAGFADRREYFQADGIHPNERAQLRMLETVWPVLRPLLAAAGKAR